MYAALFSSVWYGDWIPATRSRVGKSWGLCCIVALLIGSWSVLLQFPLGLRAAGVDVADLFGVEVIGALAGVDVNGEPREVAVPELAGDGVGAPLVDAVAECQRSTLGGEDLIGYDNGGSVGTRDDEDETIVAIPGKILHSVALLC